MDSLSGNGQSAPPSSGLSVLLIDDNASVAESIALAVRLGRHRIDCATGPEEALSRLAAARYDVILLDMNYAPNRTDGTEGLALLARILSDDPGAAVVVITAHSGVRIAVEAMRAGARDFIMKPWRNADLLARIAAAAAPRAVAAATPAPLEPARLLGDSVAIDRLRALIRRIGPTGAGVVVTGPAGSGRGLTAAALHAASPHAATPMPVIDLRDDAAWELLDAPTPTLLLRHPDRLGEVAQARLLARIAPATRCIAIADSAGGILPALARRIATVEIAAPPLAARDGDALLLARHFARIAATRYGRAVPTFTAAAEARILSGPWVDEVRGLGAAVERAILLGDGDTIDVTLLAPAPVAAAVTENAAARFDLDENERTVIEAALHEHRHNVSHAAAALGLSRGALYRRMARHGL